MHAFAIYLFYLFMKRKEYTTKLTLYPSIRTHTHTHTHIYIKNCWVRLLSNYNIKYISTIYTRLNTCLMSISRFSLRDEVTLQLLKLCFYIADVVEWSRALDIRLINWCCSVSMVRVQISLREEKKFDSSKI
jgi:hypothetical protein